MSSNYSETVVSCEILKEDQGRVEEGSCKWKAMINKLMMCPLLSLIRTCGAVMHVDQSK